MGTNFTGITFDDCNVSPSDDGIINRTILPDGILSGCEISYSGSTLTMAAGTLIACGRQFRHPAAQNWAVVDATTGYARLLITLDLTRSATDQTFDQVVDAVEYANDISGFPALVQQDLNAAGTKYQVVACVISLGTGGISGIINTMPAVHPASTDGGRLTVTAPAGSTVTVSKDGKTLTRVAGADGVVVFRGLESGTWALSITDGEQTTSKTVEIVADYATTITFFEATIHITYPAGSTCTVTDGTTTLTAPDTSGTWACVVGNAGTWTITATNGSLTKSTTVSITANGQSETVALDYLVVLFDGTSFHDELTGGWNKGNDGCTVSGGYLHIRGKGYITSKNKVDLSPYTSIKFTISNFSSDNSAKTDSGIDISNVNDQSSYVAYYAVNKNGTYSLDVSGINGSYYIDFYCDGYTDMDITYCELVR